MKLDLDASSEALNGTVILGEDTWKAIVLGSLSPYAPRILFNGVQVRNNLHVLLIGDVSSAKSQTLNILKKVAPNWESISKASAPSLEGVAIRKVPEAGILERSSPGILIVPEFQSAYYNHMQILREALDCSELRIWKKGQARIFTPNVSVMSGCNPDDDFFLKGLELRGQVKFSEGILSRFDVTIPTLASQEINEAVADRVNLFGPSSAGVNWKTMAQEFSETTARMLKVKQVKITAQQQTVLKEVFKKHNRKVLKNRPFLILRDLETLARLVNVVTVFQTNSTGVVNATDLGLDVAIGIWEHLLSLREEFYQETRRRILTIPQQIVQVLQTTGGVSKVEDIKKEICETKNLCSPATFYRKVQRLEEVGKIKHKKGPDATIEIIGTSGSWLE